MILIPLTTLHQQHHHKQEVPTSSGKSRSVIFEVVQIKKTWHLRVWFILENSYITIHFSKPSTNGSKLVLASRTHMRYRLECKMFLEDAFRRLYTINIFGSHGPSTRITSQQLIHFSKTECLPLRRSKNIMSSIIWRTH